MKIEHALIISVGTAFFYIGSFFVIKMKPVEWPKLSYSFTLMALIIGAKLFLLASNLSFDFSIENIITNLANESASQKQDIAGGVVINTIITLVFWLNLIGLSQKGRLTLAIVWFILFQIASQQTGRFLIVSQLLLLIVIHYDINSKRFNGVVVMAALLSMVVAFPLLHAIRSGDINKEDLNVYSINYISEIINADAAPGQYFFDLADYADQFGYNYGYFAAIIPLQLIPRFIWEGKPTTSLQAVYTQKIYNIDHLDGVTFTFTIFDSYSYFGIVSIAIVSAFWGLVFMNLFNFQLHTAHPFLRIQLGLLLINMFNFFRGNVSDFIAPILVGTAIAYFMDLFFNRNIWQRVNRSFQKACKRV